MAKFNGRLGALSITFDDGLLVQAQYAVKEMDDRGLRGTFFLCGKYAGRSTTLWQDVAKRHEIGSHGLGHFKAANMAPEDLLKDCQDNKAILEKTFSTVVTSHAWPYAISNKACQAVAAKVFKQCRGGHASPVPAFIRRIENCNIYDTLAFNTCANNISSVLEWTNTAVTLRSWVTLMIHGVGPDDKQFDNIPLKDFQRMLDTVRKNENLWIAPYGEVAQNLRENRD